MNAFGGLASAVEAIGVFADEASKYKRYYKGVESGGVLSATPTLEDGEWDNSSLRPPEKSYSEKFDSSQKIRRATQKMAKVRLPH